jgi:hypothetical protein
MFIDGVESVKDANQSIPQAAVTDAIVVVWHSSGNFQKLPFGFPCVTRLQYPRPGLWEEEPMDISSGKHQGKTSQIVALNHPDYVSYYLNSEYHNSKLGQALKHHVAKMDAKPFITECFHCKKPATRATAYQNNPDLMFWCDDCNPYGAGAVTGKLRTIKTYSDAVSHIAFTANGHKGFMKTIIRNLAEAKGLAKRVTVDKAAAFFA